MLRHRPVVPDPFARLSPEVTPEAIPEGGHSAAPLNGSLVTPPFTATDRTKPIVGSAIVGSPATPLSPFARPGLDGMVSRYSVVLRLPRDLGAGLDTVSSPYLMASCRARLTVSGETPRSSTRMPLARHAFRPSRSAVAPMCSITRRRAAGMSLQQRTAPSQASFENWPPSSLRTVFNAWLSVESGLPSDLLVTC